MQVHRTIENLPSFKKAVITIGTFDGVHEGHRKIIDALLAEAGKIGGESIIISFDPHPRKIVNPLAHLQLINTTDEKIELLSKTGIDHLVIVPFTKRFADQTADQYIKDFLIDHFHPHSIIIGYDHHFGKERKGNYKLLEDKAAMYQYKLLEIPKHVLEEIDVSSTKIRNALLESKIEKANKLLGYDFFFEGLVVEGDKLGRQLNFPTANLEYTDKEKIHLGHGVYAVLVQIGTHLKKGMLSIGNRPTLVDSNEKIEVNIFDWDEPLYGQILRVLVKKFLRPQKKYNNLDELVLQLHKDKEDSYRCLDN